MILIDSSAGSKDLVKYPPLNNPSLACLANLSSSEEKSSVDVMFPGCGPDNTKLDIAVEFKSLSDLISSIQSGRIQDTQIPTLKRESDRAHLLYYGEYRCGKDGNLETPIYPIVQEKEDNRNGNKPGFYWYVKGLPYQGPFSTRKEAIAAYTSLGRKWSQYTFAGSKPLPWGYLESSLLSYLEAGIPHKHFPTIADCAQWIGCLYRWWQKPYDKHSSFQTFDRSSDLRKPAIMPGIDPDTRFKMEVADRIPGVDYKRSVEIARYFSTAQDMVNAGIDEWLKISGVGKVIAKEAVRCFQGQATQGRIKGGKVDSKRIKESQKEEAGDDGKEPTLDLFR